MKSQQRAAWKNGGRVCLWFFAESKSIAHYTSLREVWATVPLDRQKQESKNHIEAIP